MEGLTASECHLPCIVAIWLLSIIRAGTSATGLMHPDVMWIGYSSGPRWPLSRSLHSRRSAACPRHAPRRAGTSAVRAGSHCARGRRPFVRSARRSVHRHRPLFQIAWRHRCRIIGWGATGGVPCASIIWLARAVKVVRPRDPDASTVDRARSMKKALKSHARALHALCEAGGSFLRFLGQVIRTTMVAVLHPPYEGLLLIMVMMIEVT